ncbi:MAG: hypothetical protein QOH26_505, partial [Actinomycetota bacterium]|nr:hypothetical protein [Actinomycetota bacterium]
MATARPTAEVFIVPRFRALATLCVLAVSLTVAVASPAASQSSSAGPPAPVDPQAWVDQKDLTWDDYTPGPGQPTGWKDGSVRG